MYNNGGNYNNDDNGDDDEEEGFVEDDNRGHSQSPQVGQKRLLARTITPNGMARKLIKVQEGKGKPKAEDWEPAVQDVIPGGFFSYKNKLVSETPNPNHMQRIVWEKAAWQDGCRKSEVKIYHNGELLKIVCGRHIL